MLYTVRQKATWGSSHRKSQDSSGLRQEDCSKFEISLWGSGLCTRQKTGKAQQIQEPLTIENSRCLNSHTHPTRFPMWPWHPIERTMTISPVGTFLPCTCRWGIPNISGQANSKHLPLDPTPPQMFARSYPQGIKCSSYLTKDRLRVPVLLSCNTPWKSSLITGPQPSQPVRCNSLTAATSCSVAQTLVPRSPLHLGACHLLQDRSGHGTG